VWKDVYGHYDWRKTQFKFDVNDAAYTSFIKNTIGEISTRKQPNDFLLPFWGNPMKPICDAHSDLLVVEPGIGYAGGHFAPYKVFESYAVHSAYYGLESVRICNEKWYDVVIPNYFNVNDFTYSQEKEDYFLYIGRVYDGKGVDIAVQTTKEIGANLIVAGQGSLKEMGYNTTPSHVLEVGYANIELRRKLMSEAKGTYVPSLYNEPFAGVQIESMLSGTPVISTDWGALAENNIHGVTGYRCRTFEQFCWAARNINNIDPRDCRKWGENFTFNKIAPMYEEYFQSILNIHKGDGWYEKNNTRLNLDWLKKEYPEQK
jgi:glycosyltransferase involved in cell wall biosynthesis